MMGPALTLIYEAPPGSSGLRRLRPFLAALETHAGQPVTVIEAPLAQAAPADGFILLSAENDPELSLDACAPELRAGLAARLVALDVSKTRVLDEILEPLSLAGAIDGLTLSGWEAGAYGLYGLKELAPRIGATCVSLYRSPRYCCFSSAKHRGLPHLLVDYLRALAFVSAEV